MAIDDGLSEAAHLPDLTGAQKVTALLLVMGKPLADRIIRNFDDSEIVAIAKTASTLPALSPNAIEVVLDQLEKELEHGEVIAGSSTEVEQLLTGVVSDERVSEILTEIDGRAHEQVWEKLATIPEGKIVEFVSGQHPQVGAFVLSKLDVTKASVVLEKMDVEVSSDLSRRLLVLKPISEEAQRLVAERLMSDVFNPATKSSNINRHAHLASILNQIERDRMTQIITAIGQHHPDDARRVRAHVFGFEDIADMAIQDRIRLMEEVPAERLVLALRDCQESLRATIIAALSPRTRRLIEAELAAPGSVPAAKIQSARRQIAALAVGLAERQVIALRPPSDGNAK